MVMITTMVSKDYEDIIGNTFPDKNNKDDKAQDKDFNRLLEDCYNIPFWSNHDRNFNKLIGLPLKENKDGITEEHPVYDYELELLDIIENNQHVWCKKARGIGFTTFTTRYLAWVCLKDNKLKGKKIFITSGTEAKFSDDIKERIKELFVANYPEVRIQSKYSEMWLNGVEIKTFPTKSLKDMRGYTDVKYIFIDEADYFEPSQQEEIGAVIRSYEEKSNCKIIMVSTPKDPEGLFARIEQDKAFKGFFYKHQMLYEKGLDKIFDREVIKKLAQDNPDFEREYNGKYQGKIGNVFTPEVIGLCKLRGRELMKRNPTLRPHKANFHPVGMDQLGGGDSPSVVVAGEFNEELEILEVLHVQSYDKTWTPSRISDDIFDLYVELGHNTKFLCDAARPDQINEHKTRFEENVDWHNPEDVDQYNNVILPIAFGNKQHENMLSWLHSLAANGKLAIPEGNTEEEQKEFESLIIAMRTAWATGWNLDKKKSVNDSHLDALRLMCRGIQFE